MQQRKRGGQPGNQNAVTHGRNSAPRKAQRAAEAAERRRQEAAWSTAAPATDYDAIVDELKRLRRAKNWE